MRRSLVGIALAAVGTTAIAQENTSVLYGVVDSYVGYGKSGSNVSAVRVGDGGILASQYGFRGRDGLGIAVDPKVGKAMSSKQGLQSRLMRQRRARRRDARFGDGSNGSLVGQRLHGLGFRRRHMRGPRRAPGRQGMNQRRGTRRGKRPGRRGPGRVRLHEDLFVSDITIACLGGDAQSGDQGLARRAG
jgi:hypothetical protein